MGFGPSSLASILVVALATYLLSTPFKPPGDPQAAHAAQLLDLLAATVYYLPAASSLANPTPATQRRREFRLKQAAATPLGERNGITSAWYKDAQIMINSCRTRLVILAASLLLVGMVITYPSSSVVGGFCRQVTFAWEFLHDQFSPKSLFVYGVFSVFFVAFWATSLLFAALDFTRPSVLLPFKIQQDFVLTKAAFAKAVLLALGNQLLVLGTAHLVWKIVPIIAPHGKLHYPPSPRPLSHVGLAQHSTGSFHHF